MNSGFAPIKKDSLSQKIQNRILNMVRDGVFEANEKLPSEREFCESFQVSRTSIREALKGLISMGVLEKRSDGTYVRENTNDIVREPIQALIQTRRIPMEKVSEARVAFECQMVRIAAEKAAEEDIETCRKMLEDTKNCKTAKDLLANKAAFHLLVAEMTKNELMIAMFSVLYDILNKFQIPMDEKEKESDLQTVSHEEILDCIARRDADAAEKAMRTHLNQVELRKYEFHTPD